LAVDRDTNRAAGTPWYSEERWARFAPLTGLLAVVLWVIGLTIGETAADAPDDEAAGAEWVAFFEEGGDRLLAGAFLFAIGSAFFVWFLGLIRTRIHSREANGRLAATVLATGTLMAAMSMGYVVPFAAGGFAAGQLDTPLEAGAAQALAVLDDGFFIAGEAAAAIFFLVVAIAGLRTRAIPVWVAWASLVFGILAFTPWLGWAVFIWGVPLWVLVLSIWMFLRGTPATETRAAPA
jgi:hypothetical protein